MGIIRAFYGKIIKKEAAFDKISEKNFAGALILNAGYEPIKVVNWQRAIVLWFQEKVDILEYHAQEVRSASRSMRLPSVLILRKYIKPNFCRSVRLSRQNIFIRDEYKCQYCYEVFPKKMLTIDHVQPVSKGGANSWENFVTACGKCNNRKADRTPAQAGMKLYKKPVRPSWPMADSHVNSASSSIPKEWRSYLNSLSWVVGGT